MDWNHSASQSPKEIYMYVFEYSHVFYDSCLKGFLQPPQHLSDTLFSCCSLKLTGNGSEFCGWVYLNVSLYPFYHSEGCRDGWTHTRRTVLRLSFETNTICILIAHTFFLIYLIYNCFSTVTICEVFEVRLRSFILRVWI